MWPLMDSKWKSPRLETERWLEPEERRLQDTRGNDFLIAPMRQWDAPRELDVLPTDVLPVTSPFWLRALRETFSEDCTRSGPSCTHKPGGFQPHVRIRQ